MIKEEKEKSESWTENENEKTSDTDGDSTLVVEDKQESSNNEDIPTKTLVYDSVKAKLMKKYSDIVSKKNKFGGTQGSWYTLKFYTMKETSAVKYYLVEMEFSNDD
jgi:hypothetical protein